MMDINVEQLVFAARGGLKIQTSSQVLDDVLEKHERVRSWKERWFTLPWRPLQKTHIFNTLSLKPSMTKGYLIGETLVIHPALYEKIKQEIGK